MGTTSSAIRPADFPDRRDIKATIKVLDLVRKSLPELNDREAAALATSAAVLEWVLRSQKKSSSEEGDSSDTAISDMQTPPSREQAHTPLKEVEDDSPDSTGDSKSPKLKQPRHSLPEVKSQQIMVRAATPNDTTSTPFQTPRREKKPRLSLQQGTARVMAELEELKPTADMTLQAMGIQAKPLNAKEKLKVLRELKPFVLDNSMRESTVGQPVGHTMEDKYKVLDLAQKAGFDHFVVAAFSQLRRIDDMFLQDLLDNHSDRDRADFIDRSNFFAFSEAADKLVPGCNRPSPEVTNSLLRCKEYGIGNVIFELNLGAGTFAWDAEGAFDSWAAIARDRVEWVRRELPGQNMVFFNFRDFPVAMVNADQRVFRFIRMLAAIGRGDESARVTGIVVEDPEGSTMPFQTEVFIRQMRNVMNTSGWENGHLLYHVHKGYGLDQASVLGALANGATGIWAGVCAEGAAVGHASTCVTLTNLARLGNKDVLRRFDFPKMRHAAIEITKICTGKPPHERMEVYGERAMDFVFPGYHVGNGLTWKPAELFGTTNKTRITFLATPQMFIERCDEVFGAGNHPCKEELGQKMLLRIAEDLASGRKEEYDSPDGLASLCERAGGVITEAMQEAIQRDKSFDNHPLMVMLRQQFELWDFRDTEADGRIPFEAFYNGFMARYVPCSSSEMAQEIAAIVDVDQTGFIEWDEWQLRARWALAQYGDDVRTLDDLNSIIFRKQLIPVYQDRWFAKQQKEEEPEDSADGGGELRTRRQRGVAAW